MLAEHAETSLQEAQQQLSRKEIVLRQLEEKCVRLEQRIAELEHLMKKDLEQISRLKTTVTALDNDKDALQGVVDDKTEKVVILNEELARKVSIFLFIFLFGFSYNSNQRNGSLTLLFCCNEFT